MSRLSALLTTEGTYPYHRGGVSTWCHALTSELGEIDFTVLAITMHPYLEAQYALAPNIRKVITVPLWGTEDPPSTATSRVPDYLQRRWSTTSQDVEREYMPAYEAFSTKWSRRPARRARSASSCCGCTSTSAASTITGRMRRPRSGRPSSR